MEYKKKKAHKQPISIRIKTNCSTNKLIRGSSRLLATHSNMQSSSAHPFLHPIDTNTNKQAFQSTVRVGVGGVKGAERQMELPLLVDFLYINGGRASKPAAWTLEKLSPQIAYCAFFNCQPSVTMVNWLWQACLHCISAVKTPLYCKTVKNHHLPLQLNPPWSTCDSFQLFSQRAATEDAQRVVSILVSRLTRQAMGWWWQSNENWGFQLGQ